MQRLQSPVHSSPYHYSRKHLLRLLNQYIEADDNFQLTLVI